MGRGRDYWEQGYPYDILVHDKYISRALNPREGIACLGFNEHYVSTHTAASNGGLPVELVYQYADLIFTPSCLDKPQKVANQR
ncbi:hypothetical protein [Aliidiomarina quisquiliarum]|uniref:hypothetical protein n=1 Tax=Aliidiomarina quisquiliarum TaxID=2938947 RepID=UPI00208EF19B|nr:hypothetical protein [Aliidiomarina quisquiliarum]MCO4319960.1 hypothetical protein [Aliidiomarina quisquiliarum]